MSKYAFVQSARGVHFIDTSAWLTDEFTDAPCFREIDFEPFPDDATIPAPTSLQNTGTQLAWNAIRKRTEGFFK